MTSERHRYRARRTSRAARRCPWSRAVWSHLELVSCVYAVWTGSPAQALVALVGGGGGTTLPRSSRRRIRRTAAAPAAATSATARNRRRLGLVRLPCTASVARRNDAAPSRSLRRSLWSL